MRLIGQIEITMATAEAVHREPKFWDKIKRGLGGKVDLDTGEVRVALEASALVDQVKRALQRLGVDNAVSLVVDDTIIFQDIEGRPGDLPDLILALSEHASVFGRGFREMKLAVEHEEGNLHLLIETRALTQHKRGEPSAYVSVGGRIRDLEPKKGETAEAYRARVEPMAKDAGMLETARMQFQSFIGRLEAALHAALPEARVEEKRAEALVVRPTTEPTAPTQDPRSPMYDPYAVYYPYPTPLGVMLDVMMISAFMHMMMPPPSIMVVHPSGAPIGTADTIKDHPEAVEASAHDPGDTGPSSHEEASHGGDMDGDGDGGGDHGDMLADNSDLGHNDDFGDGGDFGGGDDF